MLENTSLRLAQDNFFLSLIFLFLFTPEVQTSFDFWVNPHLKGTLYSAGLFLFVSPAKPRVLFRNHNVQRILLDCPRPELCYFWQLFF